MSGISVKILLPADTEMVYFGTTNVGSLHRGVVAIQNGEIIGGLCVYNNLHIQHNNEPVLLIGNITCTENIGVFALLTDTVIGIAKDIKAKHIIGPINGSTWDAYRLVTLSEKPMFSGDISQPLYYNNLFLKSGFDVYHKYYSSLSIVHKRYETDTTHLREQGVIIRSIDIDRFDDELRKIYPMCANAFANNELFSPIDGQHFIDKYKPYKNYIEPFFVQIAEDADGIVGLFFCYKGLVEEIPAIIIKTIARHPQRTYKGLIDAMATTIYNNAFDSGIRHIVHAFMHENNKSLRLSAQYGGRKINEYAAYIKSLHD